MIDICPPALVYIFFTIIQILIDFYQEKINESFEKCITGILVSALLILLCKKGLVTIAWIIVLVPFILMTFIIGLLILSKEVRVDLDDYYGRLKSGVIKRFK